MMLAAKASQKHFRVYIFSPYIVVFDANKPNRDMEKTFENDYLTFEIDQAKSIFVYTWKPTSGKLNMETFLVEAQKILEGVLESNCDFIIGNDTDFLVTISPEVQEQINAQMLSLLNNKIKKFIHVYSQELFAKVSVEQLFEENKEATYDDIFVSSLEEALKLAV